jgi:D-3-phosphoglycerate dehydrogenase
VQIGILESNDFSTDVIKKLSDLGEIKFFDDEEIDSFVGDKEILFIRLKYFIGKDILNHATKLKYICTPTTGLNHIDLKECEDRGIKIISLKGESDFLSTIRATPEHTFGLVLSLLRNYKRAFLNIENNEWNRELYKGSELYENSVGIIGFGRVGKILAKYFEAFGSKVYFYDIDDSVEEINGAIRSSSIEEVIDSSNIVILSASYIESSHKFFDKKYIDLLENKYFINTARGELVDEEYLLSKLEHNFFKGIAIDVIQNEQSNNNLDKLLKLTESNNLILTPHIAGATYSSMYRTEEFIVNKLKEYIL